MKFSETELCETMIEKHGNVTLTAQELGVSPSAITQRVQKLSVKNAEELKRNVTQKVKDLFWEKLIENVEKGKPWAMNLFSKLFLGLNNPNKESQPDAFLQLDHVQTHQISNQSRGLKVNRIPVFPGQEIPERPIKEGEITVRISSAMTGLWTPKRYFVAASGRSSSKSHSCGEEIVGRASEEKQRIVCFREVGESISASLHALIADKILDMCGKYADKYFKIGKKIITSKVTDSEISFSGLFNKRAYENQKSREKVKLIWYEEAQTADADGWDILTPTIRIDDSELWLTMNSRFKDDIIYKLFLAKDAKIPPRTIIQWLSWRDNPWYNKVMEEERLQCKETNYQYQHIWEGKLVAIVGKMIQRTWLQSWEGDTNVKYRKKFMSADTAFSTEEDADYSVLQVWAMGETIRDGKMISVLDLIDSRRGRWAYPTLVEQAQSMYQEHRRPGQRFSMKMGRMLIEKKASGQSLIQSLVKDGFPVTPFNPGSRSKVDRVYACQNKLFKGYVRIPNIDYAPWVEDFIDEVCEFSDTEEHSFDDQVDAMTQAILVWQLTNRR